MKLAQTIFRNSVITWDLQLFKSKEIVEGVNNADPYMTITYGWMLGIGYHVAKDPLEGKQILQSMFDSDYNLEARYLYAQILHYERKAHRNKETALFVEEVKILEKLADANYQPAIFQLALKHQYGATENCIPNVELAYTYYKHAARLGHIQAKKKLWEIWFARIGLKGRGYRLIGAVLTMPYWIYAVVRYGLNSSRMYR